MYIRVTIFILVLILSSCAERGYKLSSNVNTHTVIATKVSHINTKNKQIKPQFTKMSHAVKKELKKQPSLNNELLNLAQTNTKQTPKTKIEKYTPINKEDKSKILTNTSSTQTLAFKPLDQIYHTFGSSEIHGHVIYLGNAGHELSPNATQIYLLPANQTLNNWYNRYYLKNSSNSSIHATTVKFLNSTYLNLEKNFSFFGVAQGTYYIVIESTKRKDETKKVYIAKKIDVDENKKIMVVFSKKL